MPKTPFNWTCPYCGHAQAVTDPNYASHVTHLGTKRSQFENVGTLTTAISCANPKCKELSLSVGLYLMEHVNRWRISLPGKLDNWQLRPRSNAKPQPDYIPDWVRRDYEQACLIVDLSPNASATMARRCLQSMIRDFAKIQKNSLYDEISELRAQVGAGTAPQGVTNETVDAIDHLRRLGNIGAHMKVDTDRIIEIDENEAETLIKLIEMLFTDWYIARESRRTRLANIQAISKSKTRRAQRRKKSTQKIKKVQPKRKT